MSLLKNHTTASRKQWTIKVVRFFVKDLQKNHIDEHGYSGFHAACMAGDLVTVRRFINEGIDVNFDSWKCSPLHIAAQYRQECIVQLLLENAANPNQEDHLKSTPLHALAWMCLCDCGSYESFCDYRKPVEKIVEMLVKKKANIEARNEYGDSPLQLAVCRYDKQLVKSLLKHGASLDSLNEEKIFSQNFESIELKNYPLTFNIIEVIQLLQSAGYILDFKTRFLMLKCWMRVRGNADLFMTDYYTLNLPYLVCRTIAENMSDEDILHLCEHTNEENLE
ncbi:26S proteasome non-ATPase regulatory subunit 10-like [Trichogramma pretiosum]|uniref:26S proteasome non-ATPase regulatory subunit 10-like n=1 Tax=Trichogramma pretiosum TaxID=7493 RepID=UPI000C71A1F6|nr:26S proteasome non-ATPase regulatory subunit 10-like [Trichogramma pretiosum]